MNSPAPSGLNILNLACLLFVVLPLVAVMSIASTGCDPLEASGSPPGRLDIINLPSRPFNIGHPDLYKEPGVYDDFRTSHGVWIVSVDEKFLVVLSAVCPHDGYGTAYKPLPNQFRCVNCGSRFDTDGINRGSSQAERPLERLHISLTGRYGDEHREMLIRPTKRYRQDLNEWSERPSMYYWENPRADDLTEAGKRKYERIIGY